eukprot:SAG22_NODE_2402_length_2615_cov_3.309618_5_plen_108_part_00
MPTEPFRVVFTTVADPSKPDETGSFTVEVYPEWAPLAGATLLVPRGAPMQLSPRNRTSTGRGVPAAAPAAWRGVALIGCCCRPHPASTAALDVYPRRCIMTFRIMPS